VRALFRHQLRLDRVLAPDVGPVGRAGLKTDPPSREKLRTELVDETLAFVTGVVLDQNGGFRELMTSPQGFPTSDGVAKILGLPAGSRGARMLTNSRAGLLMRPAILSTARDREAPILRGITMRTRVLCDDVPPPPPDADSAAKETASTLDPTTMTTRQLYTAITAAPMCQGCHGFLNPLGFTLGSFGPLGEYRTSEKVYGDDGKLKNDFPIDSKVSNANIAAANDDVANHTELAQLVESSVKGKACLARYAFRVSRMRMETDDDQCQLGDIEGRLRGGYPVAEAVIEAAAAEDILWKGTAP
jgi:hypothetical protein